MGKLQRFWAHKAQRREGLQPGDPLFCSQSRVRISKRRVQFAFRPGRSSRFDRLYPFTRCGTPQSPTSIGLAGTYSSHRGSPATFRPSRQPFTPTHRIKKCGSGSETSPARIGLESSGAHHERASHPVRAFTGDSRLHAKANQAG